jgi:D-alanyl-D-alanine carboxypeptidase (penicillin-binding protein 5/6)
LRLSVVVLTVLVGLWPGPRAVSAALSAPPPAPDVTATSAVLIDLADGGVLWGKDPDRQLPPASTTKMMTALVVLERSSPDERVVVSPAAERVGERERFTVKQLLYALLLPSANDAAVALAEHVGGSVEGFTAMMNARARLLGADSSNFTNPHGLDDPLQLSTARDLAAIAREAMVHHELFRRIVGTASYTFRREGGSRMLINRNRLLGAYPGAVGIKTGTTPVAGEVLVAGVRRGREERVSVVLGSRQRESDSVRILDYGFEAFERLEPVKAGRMWGYATFGDGTTRSIVADDPLTVLVETGADAPEVTYDFGMSALEIRVSSGTKRAGAVLRCLESPCREIGTSGNPVVAFWEALAPLLRWAKSTSR